MGTRAKSHLGQDPTGTSTLLVAFDRGVRTWRLGCTPGVAQRPRERQVPAGEVDTVLIEMDRAMPRVGLPAHTRVVRGDEAGREGLWCHRFLVAHGVANLVVDSANLEASGLTVVRQSDFTASDSRGDGRLRDGTRIDLAHNGRTLQLLSVHLKSGCFENASTSTSCETLLEQVPVLEGWIDEAAQGPTPLIVLGDFNRRLTQPGDRVWADLDDGEPPNADLTALTQEMPVSCRDNTFTEFIDLLVVDRQVVPWVDRTSFRHITYRQADKAV
jgi:endonuclease/exonuclease/phosphatase family metal-dependent hydrolase